MQKLSAPLVVSAFLLLEFRQSVRLQGWLHAADRRKGYPKTEGERMLRDLQTDLAGKILAITPVDWADVYHRAERLSTTYTVQRGHRLADILHVATALHLGAEQFLTFDARQRVLAKSEGLSVVV